MTICVVFYQPEHIIFAADLRSYYLQPDMRDLAKAGDLQWTHENFEDGVLSFSTDVHKIFEHKGLGVLCGGSQIDSWLINLNENEDVFEQIMLRFRRNNIKDQVFGFFVGGFSKQLNSCWLKHYFSRYGEERIENYLSGSFHWVMTFSPEIRSIFFNKTKILPHRTVQEKINLIYDFFGEITVLFRGLAGLPVEIAVINSEGFKWYSKI